MSYTLNYTGSEIDDILDRAAPGGALDTAIAAKQDALTFDAVPTQGSTNPAESGGIYDAIQAGGAAALAAFATDTVSGDVVSFSDGADSIPVKSFVGSIIPIQDLNGQSAPYPAGGGANKVDQSTLTNTGVVSDTGATGTQTTRLFSALFPVTPSTTYYAGVDGKSSNNETIQFNRFIWFDSSKNFISRSSTGQSTTGVNITTPANAYYASIDLRTPALTTNLVAANVTKLWFAVGSGTVAYSPYSNICPISGWTVAEIYRTGVNILDKSKAVSGERFTTTGTTALNNNYRSEYIPVKPNTAYYVKNVRGASVTNPVWWYDANKAFISYANVGTADPSSGVVTSPSNAAFLGINFAPAQLDAVGVNYPSTVTTYEAYNGSTIVLSFGQTVYGGTLDVTNGVLTVTHAKATITSLSGSSPNYYTTVSPTPNTSTPLDIICDKMATASSFAGNGVYINSNTAIIFKTSDYATAADLMTAFGGTVDIVYALATPQTYQLTPTQVSTLLGSNTVWTDVGAVTEMEYRADTALYIQKLLNGGALSTLSMASPSPSLSLGRVGVLAEQEAEAEPEAEETTEAQEEQEAEEE